MISPLKRQRWMIAILYVSAMASQVNADAKDSSLLQDFESALRDVRATRADLALRPDRWPTEFVLPMTESLLRDPLTLPSTALAWKDRWLQTNRSSDRIAQAAEALSISLPPPTGSSAPTAVERIEAAILQAQTKLQKAVASMTVEQRATALQAWSAVLGNHERVADFASAIDASKSFDLTSLLEAARDLSLAVDQALPTLESEERRSTAKHRVIKKTSAGQVLIAGGDDQDFSAADLQSTTLLINVSRRSRYQAPVASAGENQIRLVIDFAHEVTIDTPELNRTAGAGVFGIGLLYLPTADGKKTVRTGDQSQGLGLFGVGGFFVQGSSGVFESREGAQGVGAFGVGLFSSTKADHSQLSLRYAGQGLGLPRGVGFFEQVGSDSQIEGGLYHPDPREPLAFASLCQGVGYGLRAFAAGGVGLAFVQGDRNRVTSSYFSQGSGYWHGFGEFCVLGNDNFLQARRYGQGSGVHTAAGAFVLQGERNQTVNWGVGPAYGWDMGIGTFLSDGDDNGFQTEWGSGHGEMNGHALARIRGNRNRLALANFGSGTLNRQMPSYGLALLQGNDNRVRFGSDLFQEKNDFQIRSSPWGVLLSSGQVTVDPTLPIIPILWKTPDRQAATLSERKEDQSDLQQSQSKPIDQRVGDWLSMAANAGMDGATPQEALHHLYALSADELPVLVRRITSDRFDEWVLARNVFCAYGAVAIPALIDSLPSRDPISKVVVMNLLFGSPPELVYPVVLPYLTDSDWRVRKVSAFLLTSFVDREMGSTPGRLTLLKGWRAAVDHPEKIQTMGPFYLIDAFSVLAMDPKFSVEDRIKVSDAISDPWSPVRADALSLVASYLHAHESVYATAIDAQIAWAETHRKELRKHLLPLLRDPDPEVRLSVLTTLAQIGEPEDAKIIGDSLSDPLALVREGAAAALGKMGPLARGLIKGKLSSPTAAVRAMATLAAVQSSDAAVIREMKKELDDSDEQVRLTALTALTLIQPRITVYRKDFKPSLVTLSTQDPSPSVRSTALYVLSLIKQ